MTARIVKTQYAEVVSEAIRDYSDAVGERLILEAVDCPSISQVAANCGVPYQVLRRWLQLGLDGDPRYSRFAVEFENARSRHETRWLGHVEAVAEDTDPKAANARLRAATWLLEKHFPKQYGNQIFVATMIDQQADGYNLSILNHDQKRDFLRALKLIKAANEQESDEEIKRLQSKLGDRPKQNQPE